MSDALHTAERSLVLVSPASGGTASGVVVRHRDGKTYVLTCAHVVGKDKTVELETPTHKKLTANTLRVHRTADIALVCTPEPMELAEIELGTMPDRYEDVWMLGCPLGEFGVPARGIVGPYSEDEDLLQVTITSTGGCSGAPIVDHEGRLVALLSSGLLRGSQELINYSFAVPVDTIKRFISRALRTSKVKTAEVTE